MLKKSLRTLVLTLFVTAFVVVISGCGGKKEEVKTETTKAPAMKVEKKVVKEAPVEEMKESTKGTSTTHVAPPPKDPEMDIKTQKQKILDEKTKEIEANAPPPKTSSRSKAKFKDHSGG